MFGGTRRLLALVIVSLILITAVIFVFNEEVQRMADSSLSRAQSAIDDISGRNRGDSTAPAEGDAKDQPVQADHAMLSRENATFFTLCRNKDINGIVKAIHSVEAKFNHKHHYDWVFLNDEEFTGAFKKEISQAASGTTHFGKIDWPAWGYPDFIDMERAEETLQWMFDHDVIYGDQPSYHHMCRFQSGYFYRHPLMEKYRYAWRVEPDISILCMLDHDPFRFMRENGIKYGFNVAPQEIRESITTLWNTTKEFLALHPEYVVDNNLRNFISDDDLETYNLCHYWSNFEISDLDFLRSKEYGDYFDFLDQAGGFYYERWGDAPIRSIAASLFLPASQVHFFNEIGYFHSPYGHCPYNQGPLELNCECHPKETEAENLRFYDFNKNSCMRRYFKAKGRSFLELNPDVEKR